MPQRNGREVERLMITNDRLWKVVIVLLALVVTIVGRYGGFDVSDILRILALGR